MKVLSGICGALLVIAGVYCLMTPVATFASIGWVVGASMLVDGIGDLFTWGDRKSAGEADGFSLVAAILSVAMGVIVLVSGFARLGIDAFFAYLVAIWMFVGGASRIMVAFKLRGQGKAGNPAGQNWILVLVLGILQAIMGVLCIAHPMIAVISMGAVMGMSVIAAGCSLIAAAFAA